MRPVRASLRTIVHGTEDEERVRQALLFALAQEDTRDARGRLTRSRMKSHFGASMLFYEGVLKHPKELRRFFDQLRETPGLSGALRDEFKDRLDDDNVLHFRLDKQQAVRGRIALGSGGDAIDVNVKYERRGDHVVGFPFDEPV